MENGIKIVSSSVTDRGLSEKRPENEDSYLEIRDRGIFAVADGVGGAEAGEVASQMAMEILAEAFANRSQDADVESVLLAAIERSNSAIFQMAHELPQLSNMATTIVALHLDGKIATIGHVGDSRLYRVDHEGNLYRETDDHSMVAEEVRAGRMTEEQAENHPSRNVISRALGAEPTVEVDLKTIMVEPGTAFLICSDGITRHVADQEIKGVLTFGGEPEEICEYLKDLCYKRGAEDNLTAVVVKVTQESALNGNGIGNLTYEEDEPTLATARIREGSAFAVPDDTDDELLELDTADLTIAPGTEYQDELELGQETLRFEQSASDVPSMPHVQHANEFTVEDEELRTNTINDSPIVPVPVAETNIDREPEQGAMGHRRDDFSMFGNSAYKEDSSQGATSKSKIVTAIATLAAGVLIGLGAYHFLIAPTPLPQQQVQPISVMQSNNQQLSAFEENRRTVDRMPTEALIRFGADPRDAEDYFLVGRAQMLSGQYAESRKSFAEAINRIAAGDVDHNNRRTIETEIAIGMAVLNDSTVQNILKTQLNAVAKTGANTNANITQ